MKDSTPLQSYLQFCVPLRVPRSKWYLGLEAVLGGVRGVNWHSERSFHITAAFIRDMLNPTGLDQIATILREELQVFRLLTSLLIPLWRLPELAVTSIMFAFLQRSPHRH